MGLGAEQTTSRARQRRREQRQKRDEDAPHGRGEEVAVSDRIPAREQISRTKAPIVRA